MWIKHSLKQIVADIVVPLPDHKRSLAALTIGDSERKVKSQESKLLSEGTLESRIKTTIK